MNSKYGNTTYQIMRKCVADETQTVCLVRLKSGDQDTSVCQWIVRQFIRVSFAWDLHKTIGLVESLNAHGIVLMEYSITTSPIGNRFQRRDMYLKTCLINSKFGFQNYPDGVHQYRDVYDIPTVDHPDPKIGIKADDPNLVWLEKPDTDVTQTSAADLVDPDLRWLME